MRWGVFVMKFKALGVSVAALAAGAVAGPAYADPPVCKDKMPSNFKTYVASSLSASEASTSQVLELMSQRRTEEAGVCPAGFERVQNVCRPIRPTAARAPVKKAATPRPAKADRIAEPEESTAPTTGAWIEAFADYERRTVSGVQTQKAAGAVFGIDRTTTAGPLAMRFGVLGGFTRIQQESSAKRTDTFDTEYTVTLKDGAAVEPDKTLTFTVEDVEHTFSSTSRQTLDGFGLGVSASLAKGRFFLDTVAKVDFYDVRGKVQTSDSAGGFKAIFNFEDECIPGLDFNGDPVDPLFTLVAVQTALLHETTMRNFVVAGNFGYRSDLPDGYWLEPTVGLRFTYSDFASDAALLGLKDGHALRLEAGARVGKAHVLNDGSVWSNSLGLFAYSDVIVDGFVIDAVGSSFESDEGKLRFRASLQSKLQLQDGVSLYGELGARVGEDYWGVSGKLGGRVEW